MLVKINGRLKCFNRVSAVTRASASTYRVEASHGTFEVVGGRQAGGTSREWFVYHAKYFPKGPLDCTSLVEACKLIDNM